MYSSNLAFIGNFSSSGFSFSSSSGFSFWSNCSLQISLLLVCSLLSHDLKQHGKQYPSGCLSSFSKPGFKYTYSPEEFLWYFGSVNSYIFSPGDIFFALWGIIFPYFPDLTCSSVKLTPSEKLQYLGQMYQNSFSFEVPYLIALS